MKHFIILILALIPLISSCKKDNDDIDLNTQIREIAWNSLSEQAKSTVIIDWKQVPVTETTYQEKIVYLICFNTSEDALLGPICVYIDKKSLAVLGQGLRM